MHAHSVSEPRTARLKGGGIVISHVGCKRLESWLYEQCWSLTCCMYFGASDSKVGLHHQEQNRESERPKMDNIQQVESNYYIISIFSKKFQGEITPKLNFFRRIEHVNTNINFFMVIVDNNMNFLFLLSEPANLSLFFIYQGLKNKNKNEAFTKVKSQ